MQSDPALLKWTQTMLLRSDPKEVGTVADPTTGWQGTDGDWRLLVACNRSAVCQYKSKSKSFIGGNWSYAGQFAPAFASECPDYYRLRTASSTKTKTWLLSGGKLGMFFRLGTYIERQGEVDKFTMLPGQLPFPNRSISQALDIGTNYFGAPKSFEDTSPAGGGRRILFGSIGGPPCRGAKWAGLQSLPRVVTLDELGDGIKSNPIPELVQLRTRTTVLSAVNVAAHSTLALPSSCSGIMLDNELELPLTAGMNLTLVVLAGPSGEGGVPITLTTAAEGGAIVPSLQGVPFRIGTEEALTLRVVVDVITVEAFAQGGRRASTTVACPPVNSTTVSLINSGGSALTVSSLNVSQLRAANILSPETPSTPPLKSDDALGPAPLVCAAVGRFIAVSWNPTCECTGNVTQSFCGACYNGTSKLSAYTCRKYANLLNFAHLAGGIGPATPGSVAQAIDFGTFSNVSVPCAIDPSAPPANLTAGTCSHGKYANPVFLGVGTAAQPPGERYLLMDFVAGSPAAPLGPISGHADDVIPLPDNSKCIADYHPFTGLWWDHGVQELDAQARHFFAAYKAAGGELDELTADWESVMFHGTPLESNVPIPHNRTAAGMATAIAYVSCARDRFDAVEKDPRWPAALAELTALGFMANGTDDSLADTLLPHMCMSTPNASLRIVEGVQLADCAQVNGIGEPARSTVVPWHAYLMQRETAAWTKSILPAARKHFPAVRLSMYGHYQWDPKHCTLPGQPSVGFLNCQAGYGASGVSVSAPVYYDEWLTFDCLHPTGTPPPPHRQAEQADNTGPDSAARCAGSAGISNTLKMMGAADSLNFTGFNIARVVVNHFRTLALASAAAAAATRTDLAPWVGWKGFMFDYKCPTCPEPTYDGEDRTYWQERILHFGLTGAARFYYFNVFYECIYFKRATHADDDAMSATLAELETVVGCDAKERRWIPDASTPWASSFILSGMEVGTAQSRRAWRFSPELPTAAGSTDPHSLVQSAAGGTLVLGPLVVSVAQSEGPGEMLHTDCTLSFGQGVVLEVMSSPAYSYDAGRDPEPTASPGGLWIVQPIAAPMPRVACGDGFKSGWPPAAAQRAIAAPTQP